MTGSALWLQQGVREVIAGFLKARCDAATSARQKESARQGMAPDLEELTARFAPEAWIAEAARRVSQLRSVTHTAKATHPGARGSSLLVEPAEMLQVAEVGSHTLGSARELDVEGNAAALDVNAFLRLEFDGVSFLQFAARADPNFGAALTPDEAQATLWMRAFASLTVATGEPTSHTYSKQVYWLVGDDPHADSSFHLLAPLYPTSLVHRLYGEIQHARFSEDAKGAREARRTGVFDTRAIVEYPQLLVQKIGGTKPQNVSQLNSARRGTNYLLASAPPRWTSQRVKPLLRVTSIFTAFRNFGLVRARLRELQDFLSADPDPTSATRRQRDEIVLSMLDDFVQFTAEYHALASGWTAEEECILSSAQKSWLDPRTDTTAGVELASAIADAFGEWLNRMLGTKLPVGDAERLYWAQLASDTLICCFGGSEHGPD